MMDYSQKTDFWLRMQNTCRPTPLPIPPKISHKFVLNENYNMYRRVT